MQPAACRNARPGGMLCLMMRDKDALRHQYADSSRLGARANLHALYSTNRGSWHRWAHEQADLSSSREILEIGCGPGFFWRDNLDRVPPEGRIVLSDASQGMVLEARRELPESPFSFTVLDAQSIPFPDKAFDVVIANHMLYHVQDLDAALSEMNRVLTDDGILLAATNGLRHMSELWTLTGLVRPPLPFAERRTTKTFNLENGRDVLSRHFSRVDLRRYDDSLAITEVQPLVDYVLSIKRGQDEVDERSLSSLADLARKRIEQDGAFHVTKDSGLFLCRKG